MPGKPVRNTRGQFAARIPTPTAKSATLAVNVPAMTHAVVVRLGSTRNVLSLHTNVEQARREAKASIFADATVESL